ncbi:hypothetical protein [Cryobacterium sp. TMT1-19]|uniref:hypothetical protein n=1 Tax=Cryobacterium sp. TMT1-19 TaxID=1259231 RepID=UPI00106971D1|nr:hypothetical protein [Cryobacterium sp. TMT1-19]
MTTARESPRHTISCRKLIREVRSPRSIVTSAIEAVDVFVRSEGPAPSAYAEFLDDIARFTSNLLDGRPTGGIK